MLSRVKSNPMAISRRYVVSRRFLDAWWFLNKSLFTTKRLIIHLPNIVTTYWEVRMHKKWREIIDLLHRCTRFVDKGHSYLFLFIMMFVILLNQLIGSHQIYMYFLCTFTHSNRYKVAFCSFERQQTFLEEDHVHSFSAFWFALTVYAMEFIWTVIAIRQN